MAIYITCAAVFVWDITSTDTLAFGVLYIPLVATALTYHDRRAVWVLATIACLMVIAGTFIPSIDPHTIDLAFNRLASIIVLLGTAFLVRYVRAVQEKLSAQVAPKGPVEVTHFPE